MKAVLTVSGDDLPADRLQELVGELALALQREGPVEVGDVQRPMTPGERGTGAALGQIVITFLTSGAAVAVARVLRAYLASRPSIRFKFEGPDGQKLVIEADNASPEQVEHYTSLLRTFTSER